jgi:agmatinase
MMKDEKSRRELFKPVQKYFIPLLYDQVPSFLKSDVVQEKEKLKEYDFAVIGVPWEGRLTWSGYSGGYSGCELAPRKIRMASARYNGFIPEIGFDFFDVLNLCDWGDVSVVLGDTIETFNRVEAKVLDVLESGTKPLTIGGDHSVTIPIFRALSKYSDQKIGLIHFDAHFDNMSDYAGDRFARCCPIARISELDNVPSENIVQIGIRGPRNTAEQAKFAEEMGATVYTMFDIRERGIKTVVDEAIEIASNGTDLLYYTLCGDILDPAYAPGVAPDPMGLSSYEVLKAVYEVGKAGLSGFDIVEFYPDPRELSFHMATWIAVYTLSGIASSLK